MEEAGQPAPEYRQNEFVVYAPIRQHGDAVTSQLNGGINDSQKMTLEYIRQHEGYNTRQISVGLDMPFDTIDKHIRVLVKNGFIEHCGSKKTGGYYVK